MAGVYKARSARGKYAQAGYVHAQPMYIAKVPAGSAQDDLRDLNRVGYRSNRPWNEVPVFEAAQPMETVAAPAPRRKVRARQKTFAERFMEQAGRERGDVVVCVLLLCVIMMMMAAWGQNIIAGADIQHSINMYQANTVAFERDNERIEQQLELARGGERIRNLAQNELGMLRPERAMTQTIYIQPLETPAQAMVQNQEEPGMDALDILLGLLSVFHIGE